MTPLQLKDTRITSVDFELNSDDEPVEEGSMELSFHVVIQGFEEEFPHTDEDEPVHLSLKVTSAESEVLPVRFAIEIQGLFTLHGAVLDWDREEQLKLLRRNGSSMLYSQLREFVIYLSVRAAGEPVHLPSISPTIFDGIELSETLETK